MKFSAHFVLLTVNILYGLNFSIAKDVMPSFIQPFGFIFYRVLGALLFFWLIGLTLKKQKIIRKDFFVIMACGFFGVCANQLMFFYGLNITSPVNAGIIMTINPVLILISASIILKTALSWKKIIGILLGLVGALVLILGKLDTSVNLISKSSITGDLFVFLNALSYSVYLVIISPIMKKYHPILVIKWVFLFGFIYTVPFTFKEAINVDWTIFSSYTWFAFFFVIIGATCLTYVLNLYGLKKLNPTVVASYIYLQPIVAATVTFFRHKEVLSFIQILAAGTIFFGVYLVSKPKKKFERQLNKVV